MVSKLLLAVQETILRTRRGGFTGELIESYYDIRAGLSFNKPPDVYGAFPTDPYSHTPKGQGAKQPGMTGLVKEEILTRQAELGFFIKEGMLAFDLLLLDPDEFLDRPASFNYWDINGEPCQLDLKEGTLACTICQVPVVLRKSEDEIIEVYRSDGSIQKIDGHVLDSASSRHIFQRDGSVNRLVVHCGKIGVL
jgi:hypothetical protein